MGVERCGIRWLPMLLLMLLICVVSCTEETKINVASKLKPGKMPTMSTRNISTLISDSGVTQYKIVAPLWEVYDEGEKPYWRFPEGIFLKKFDRKLKVIATIAADSAIYFKNEGLWRLDGRVEVTKVPRELFLSQQVFWDQNRGRVYSDSFIHIENTTHMMEGYGFTAKQDFSEYRILKPLGIFPAERDKLSGTAPPGAAAARGESGAPQGSRPASPEQIGSPEASGASAPAPGM